MVFLKAWQALPNFKGQSTFYNWLYQIAVNCSIDFLRKQKREVVLLCEELPENPDDILQTSQMVSISIHSKLEICRHAQNVDTKVSLCADQ